MEKKFDLNVAHIPKELKLIFEIINKEDVDSLQASVKESFNNIDWDLFIELAMHHRIYPLLSTEFKKIAVDFVPSYVIQIIEQAYKRNTFYMLHLASVMEQVCKLFNESKINI